MYAKSSEETLCGNRNPRITWEGCSVLLDINDGDRVLFSRLNAGAKIKIGNKNCSLQPLIGCPFGSSFQVDVGEDGPFLSRVGPASEGNNLGERMDCEIMEEFRDNRALVDNNTTQSLTGEDIDEMRRKGVTGDEIVEALIANSATFEKKTAFSQEKYRIEKQKKYAPRVLVRRPFARSTCEAYFKKQGEKIGFLRVDTLSLLLSLANVTSNSDVLVLDMLDGIITGAVAERLGGMGYVCNTYCGTTPYPVNIVRMFNFSNETCKRIVHASLAELQPSHSENSTSIDHLEDDSDIRKLENKEISSPSSAIEMDESYSGINKQSVDNGAASQKTFKAGEKAPLEAIQSWKQNGFSSLIIAAPDLDAWSIAKELVPLLSYSAPFVIYHQYLQEEEETPGAASNICTDVDKISQLPDDILISIISRLTVAEAVCTSILSTRWRELHRYITRLDFSPTAKQIQKFKEEEEERHKRGGPRSEDEILKDQISEEELVKHCTSVIDRILRSHKAVELLEEIRLNLPWFMISTCLDNRWPIGTQLVERWLKFLFSKQVQIIHLNVNSFHLWFPFRRCCFIAGKYLPSFKTLKELSLTGVDVDDEVLGLLLLNFVALERLSVDRSDTFRVVSIVGAPKLKHLSISGSWLTKSIEIRDMMNLESLRCYHCPFDGFRFVLENVPRLVEVDTDCEEVGPAILTCANKISEQLVKLKLSSYTALFPMYDHTSLPEQLVKLKHVELECSINCYFRFQELVRFIDACPCLQILGIKLKSITIWSGEQYGIDEVKKASNDNLKRVKLSGLLGYPREIELGSYIVGKATALEEFVIEICRDRGDESRQRWTCDRLRDQFRPILRDSVIFTIN